MAAQEVRCFARMLDCEISAIEVFDLLERRAVASTSCKQADMLLLGGSGHYSASAAKADAWLRRVALDCAARDSSTRQADVRILLGLPSDGPRDGRPMRQRFAECRGRHDRIAAHRRRPRRSAVSAICRRRFAAQAGHEDHVVELPPDAVLLASSARVRRAGVSLRRPADLLHAVPSGARSHGDAGACASPIRNTSRASRACRSTSSFTACAKRRKRIRCCGGLWS